MREEIIEITVELMNRSGVKFTIDDIAAELRISKKTVYKYFKGKEELAAAVFDKIISDTIAKQQSILASINTIRYKIKEYLIEYIEIYRLTSSEIFNLYSLSKQLRDGIVLRINDNWCGVEELFEEYFIQQDKLDCNIAIMRIIIEGSYDKIYHEFNRRRIASNCLDIILA